MEPRGRLLVYVSVCLAACAVLGNEEGHGSICRPHERFLSCGGCQKTCKDPAPVCLGVCQTGCYCNEDEVRDDSGKCIKLSECPPIAPAKLQSSEPRTTDMTCPTDEEYRSCEPCNKTCDNPNPKCPAQCNRGCFCKDNLVRDVDGRCVKVENCSRVKKNETSPAKLQSSEPRTTDMTCPTDEEYRSCEPCNKTCDNPNPKCPAQCNRGCFCKDNLVRDVDGRCVKVENCSKVKKSVTETLNILKAIPVAYQLICGPHQVYNSCQSCERTCNSPTPVCRSICSAGCFCEDGYFKGPDGHCVKLEKCPKAEVSYGGAHETSIEDCSSDEVYLSCGWCEPSCWNPKPECPRGVCTRGCLCRPPLVRHHNGRCVHEENCSPQKCPNPNEEYVCRYGCEARCDAKKCLSRPRKCVLGCHCTLGLYRDDNGKCVTLSNCQNNANTTKTNHSFVKSSEMFDTPSILVRMTQIPSPGEDSEYTKSVFGPIPENFINNPLPITEIRSISDPKPQVQTFHGANVKPYKDVISRAVKMYKEFLGNTNNGVPSNRYVPKALKASSRVYRDDDFITKEGFKSNDVRNNQFFVNQNSQSTKDANVRTYMNYIINVMKEMIPEPINFTITNYPLWSYST